VFSLIRYQLSHTVGIHAIRFIMCGSYKIAVYAVLLSAEDDKTLLLIVRVRHVTNARIVVAYTSMFSCGKYIQSYYVCQRYVRVS